MVKKTQENLSEVKNILVDGGYPGEKFANQIIEINMAFLPLCTIKFYHINAEKSLSTDFSPQF